jgi:hypothetical protein
MKKKWFCFGFLVIMLVFGFVSCKKNDGSVKPKVTVRIIDLPSGFGEDYRVFISLYEVEPVEYEGRAALGIKTVAYGDGLPEGGVASIGLLEAKEKESDNDKAWGGSGEYYVELVLFASGKTISEINNNDDFYCYFERDEREGYRWRRWAKKLEVKETISLSFQNFYDRNDVRHREME